MHDPSEESEGCDVEAPETTTKPTLRIKDGCVSCRRRHTRCDDNQPSCVSCEQLRIPCERIYHGLKFRHMTKINDATLTTASPANAFTFSSDQRWAEIPNELSFVRDFADGSSTPEAGSPVADAASPENSQGATESEALPLHTTISHEHSQLETEAYPTDLGGVEHFNDSFFEGASCSFLPLATAEEALLFRHFFTKMSSWFDINDWAKNCSRELFRRSSKSRLLLKAIHALASRHLTNLSQLEPERAEHYHNECMNDLIPRLTNPEVLVDDHIFAATVILRTKEEMEAHLMEREVYLLGIKAFTNSERFEHEMNFFRKAIYWVALRQEIHCSLVRQRPLTINLNVSFLEESSLSPSSPSSVPDSSNTVIWTQHCIMNLANIIMYCFGETTELSTRRNIKASWQELWNCTTQLSFNLPAEYQSFFYISESIQEDSFSFPQVWLLSETAIHVQQYLTFSKILLSCLNPTVPTLGIGSRSILQKNQDSIISLLRYLCGTGLADPNFGPGMFLACLGISLIGDRITLPYEREYLLRILNETQEKHGWQTASITVGLLSSWEE